MLNRKSIRFKEYDYSQNGMYFFTVCTQGKQCLFGGIIDGEISLSEAGKMIKTEWFKLTERFKNIELDEFIIMPNHFHGIICIDKEDFWYEGDEVQGQAQGTAPTGRLKNVGVPLVGTHPTDINSETLGDIIGAFKSITTNAYIQGVKNNNWTRFNKKLWQRNYYEHIIRNEKELKNIREYIFYNPGNWEKDEMFV